MKALKKKLLSRNRVNSRNVLFGALVLLLLISGCGQIIPDDAADSRPVLELPTQGPTVAPSPVSTRVMPADSLTPSPTATITPIPDETLGLVIEVIDGDTLAIVLDGDPMSRAYEVRLLGVDAPPNISTEPWGVVAYETSAALANLKVVRLVRDETDFDDDGYLLRYVYVGDTLLNTALVAQGLAQADDSAPNSRFETAIRAAEAEARSEELGIWGDATPTPTPEKIPPPSTAVAITATVTVSVTPTVAVTVTQTVAATLNVTTTQTITPQTTGSPSPTGTPAESATGTATTTPEADPDSGLRGPSN